MSAVTLTLELAHATGRDAGNASMRKAGRARWSDEDWNACAETTMRFAVWGGFLPPEIYEREFGRAHPITSARAA